jgi:hypothetical protein
MDDGIKTLERLGFYFLVKSNDNGPARQVEVKTNLLKTIRKLGFRRKNRLFGEKNNVSRQYTAIAETD